MKTPLLAGLAGAMLLSVPPVVVAQNVPFTVVVTASRSAETMDDTLVPVTVVTREQIDRSGAATLPEVLSTVPGVMVTRNGGEGQPVSLMLRGTESDHVLVLIDGVKAGSATLGTAPFQHIPLAQVERVEVVRGSRSSLYGSEAIGGVIQIFTRRGGVDPQQAIAAGAGSHDTGEVSGGISGGSDNAWYSLHASAFTTDGFDACRAGNGGCWTDEPDEDGYDRTAFSLRAGSRVGERLVVDAALLDSSGEVEFDGSFQNRSETLTRVGHLRGVYTVNDRWTSSLQAGVATDENENFLDQTFASLFKTRRNHLTWQNEIAVGRTDLILGVDHISEEVDSNTPFAVDSRDNVGVFTAFHPGLAVLDLELSLRNDDNEQFGSETTGGIAMGREIGEGLRATLSWGEAFKAPSFNELYYPGFGNPDLGAETARSWDFGLSGYGDHFRWSLNVFSTRIESLIGYDPTARAPVNIGAAEIDGLELAGGMGVGDWQLSAVLTLQDPRDAGGGTNDGNQLPRRAKHVLNLGADRRIGRWSIGATVLSRGSSYDGPSNRNELGGFTVVDLRAGLRLRRHWTLGIEINNLFDENYETAAFYNQDGTNVMATLRYRGGSR